MRLTHMARYKTKTQAKRALRAIEQKSFALFEHGCMTLNDVNAVKKICTAAHKRL
mgnify:CR=1 FL=1